MNKNLNLFYRWEPEQFVPSLCDKFYYYNFCNSDEFFFNDKPMPIKVYGKNFIFISK